MATAPPPTLLAAAYAGETECWACGATVRVPVSSAGVSGAGAGGAASSSSSGAPAPAFYCGWCRAICGTIPRARARAGLGQAINAALFSAGRAFPCISLAVITVAVYCGVGYVLPCLFEAGDGGGGGGHRSDRHHHPAALATSTAAAALISFNIFLHFAGVACARPERPGAGVSVHPRGAVPQGAYEGHTQCRPCGGAHKPPGTHHCAACGACSRWHDHHCFFTGTCVSTAPGGSVGPHFLLMCGWILVGSAYALAAVAALFAARRGEVSALVGATVAAAGLTAAVAGVAARVGGLLLRWRPAPPPPPPAFPALLAPTAVAVRALARAAAAAEARGGPVGGAASTAARTLAAALALPAAAASPAAPPWLLAAFTLAGIAGAALTGVSILLAQVLARLRAGASLADAGRPVLVLAGRGDGGLQQQQQQQQQAPRQPAPPSSLRAALERTFGPGPPVLWLLPPYGGGGGGGGDGGGAKRA